MNKYKQFILYHFQFIKIKFVCRDTVLKREIQKSTIF